MVAVRRRVREVARRRIYKGGSVFLLGFGFGLISGFCSGALTALSVVAAVGRAVVLPAPVPDSVPQAWVEEQGR